MHASDTVVGRSGGNNDGSNGSGNDIGNDGGADAAIVGGVIGAALMACLVLFGWFVKRTVERRRRQRRQQESSAAQCNDHQQGSSVFSTGESARAITSSERHQTSAHAAVSVQSFIGCLAALVL
jgi:hypothetical protein